MYRYSGIQVQVLPPSTGEEWWDRLDDLMSLRQEGRAVSGFAQLFWTCATGLNLSNVELKLYLNDCLDEPFSQVEMQSLQILDFWGFVSNLESRTRWNLWETPDGNSGDKMATNMPGSDHKMAATMPEPLSRRAIRRERFASQAAGSAPTPKMATIVTAPVFKRVTTVSAPAVKKATVLTTPVPQRAVAIPAPVVKVAAIPASQPLHKMAASPTSPVPAKPQLLVSSLLDPQMTSVQVSKSQNTVMSSLMIPRATEVRSLSSMTPVLAMAPRYACCSSAPPGSSQIHDSEPSDSPEPPESAVESSEPMESSESADSPRPTASPASPAPSGPSEPSESAETAESTEASEPTESIVLLEEMRGVLLQNQELAAAGVAFVVEAKPSC
ncbi:angiomotin-like isoform X1 [Tachysurus fulvidraco]|uniref:angiomotin-like isoform X1 n=1 Tax=Tachysurus fulvidraco TaxID=1234273 RepID=UPI001FF021DF|nr:angiomotin-like isoform X1 [Tachysurus fulvidraco]XP_047678016.1 angiomotin-like isoform X1 [Tachysurus fulvidraco]